MSPVETGSPQVTKPVEVYQLIIAFLILLGIVIGTAVNINSRITALEVKQKQNDDFQTEIKGYFNKLQEGQTQMLIKLEGKENRPYK